MMTFCVTTLPVGDIVVVGLLFSGDNGVWIFACFWAVACDTSSFNLDDEMSPICCAWATVNVLLIAVGVGDAFAGTDCVLVVIICPALLFETTRLT